MPKLFSLFVLVTILGCNVKDDGQKGFPEGQWIDLTYAYDEHTIFWPTAEPFALDTVFAGLTDSGFYYTAFQFCVAEHGGTHLDAPVHFSAGKWSTEQIPLDQTIGDAIVIDVSDPAKGKPDYQISISDVLNWEKEHGQIPDGSILLFHTGYGKFWPNAEAYMGTAERGPDAVAKLHFPGIAPELADWLVKNRSVKAVGLDTPSLDYGQSKLFETHQILFKENIPGFENLANLDQLPEQGAFIVALPMKIKGGSGGPLRIAAFLPLATD